MPAHGRNRTLQDVVRHARLTHVPPPYEHELPLPPEPLRPAPYSLLIRSVELPDGGGSRGHDGTVPAVPEDLSDEVDHLHLEHDMPVFVRPDRVPKALEAVMLGEAVARSSACLLLPDMDTRERALELLTEWQAVPSRWVAWLRLVLGENLGQEQEEVIHTILGHCEHYRSVEDLLADHGPKARTARRRLAAAGLPAAGTWLRASRVLHGLLEL